jgi:hypothetical protein
MPFFPINEGMAMNQEPVNTLALPLGVQLMDALFKDDPDHYLRIVQADAEIESLPLSQKTIEAIVATVTRAPGE